MQLYLAGNPAADALLAEQPLALLIGMLLDQQVPIEKAFSGPAVLVERLGHLDPARIAGHDTEDFVRICTGPPAIHRFPRAMAGRIQALCRQVATDYAGDAAAVWRQAADGADALRRLRELPGFGAQKAKIFLALLGKQAGLRLAGWASAAAPYAEPGTLLSVADITGPETLQQVREHKAALKRAARAG